MRNIALCIGNNDYSYLNKLSGAVNDAKDIGNSLKKVGFEVTVLTNLDTSTLFCKAVEELVEKARACDLCLFFYAGHGFEIDGNNILAHTQYNPAIDKRENIRYSYKLNELIEAMSEISNNIPIIIIIDACRTDPTTRGGIQSFSPVQVPKGSLIAFSTSPGQAAYENQGHGYYTQALLDYIAIPMMPIESIFKLARKKLYIWKNGEQIPWEHTSLIDDVFITKHMPYDFSYSEVALSDSKFISENDLVKKIITGLKSYNFYTQGDAIDVLKDIKCFDIEIDDLFVIGRNIYQAAVGNCFKAQEYIDCFSKINIPNNVKIHIMNGMAYEIYFDKQNLLREVFKDNYYPKIIKYLETDMFTTSKAFINDQLSRTNSRLIYHPDQAERIILEIDLEKIIDEEAISAFYLTCIRYKEVAVFSHSTSQYQQDREAGKILKQETIKNLRKIISRCLIAPPDKVLMECNISENDDFWIYFPSDITFKY